MKRNREGQGKRKGKEVNVKWIREQGSKEEDEKNRGMSKGERNAYEMNGMRGIWKESGDKWVAMRKERGQWR